MVYSTCSLNPIENEAVLHRILVETQDSVQLVDCRHLVPGLVCDPGIVYLIITTFTTFILIFLLFKISLFLKKLMNIFFRYITLVTSIKRFTIL